VAAGIATGSVVLTMGGLALEYVDRHLVPASLTTWDLSDVSGHVVNMAIPVLGYVIASRRPTTGSAGWLWWRARHWG
jgi:hypothetical protein